MSEHRCETCACWKDIEDEKDDDGDTWGECRRHAPLGLPHVVNETAPAPWYPARLHARWPLTVSYDWCGEHQPRPVVKTPEKP